MRSLLALALVLGFGWSFTQIVFAESGTDATPAPDAWLTQFGRREPRVHDPSTIVTCKDQFWLFATGNGIGSWHSKDLTNWEVDRAFLQAIRPGRWIPFLEIVVTFGRRT